MLGFARSIAGALKNQRKSALNSTCLCPIHACSFRYASDQRSWEIEESTGDERHVHAPTLPAAPRPACMKGFTQGKWDNALKIKRISLRNKYQVNHKFEGVTRLPRLGSFVPWKPAMDDVTKSRFAIIFNYEKVPSSIVRLIPIYNNHLIKLYICSR